MGDGLRKACLAKLSEELAVLSGKAPPRASPKDPSSFHGPGLFPLCEENSLSEDQRLTLLKSFKDEIPSFRALHPQNISMMRRFAVESKLQDDSRRALTFLLRNIGSSYMDKESMLYLLASLKRMLSEEPPNVRASLLPPLAKYRGVEFRESVLDIILSALADPDERVSSSAKEALGRCNTSILEALREKISCDNPFVAAKACELIGEMGALGKAASADLSKVLSTAKDWTLREAAAKALGACGGPDVKAALVNVLNDEKPQVQASAARALLLAGLLSKDDAFLDRMARTRLSDDPLVRPPEDLQSLIMDAVK